jgi:adenylosuccinate synthase
MKAILVAGLAFGDEGKGTMVDFLCRHYGAKLVVRYNGGPQAGHNVITEDGRHHCFAQFGSGSFIPGCQTYLSEHMLIEPYAMINEHDVLKEKDTWGIPYPYVDPNAIIITPWQWMANRIKELARGGDRHGSCGMGIGEAQSDHEEGKSFLVCDILSPYARERLHIVRAKNLAKCMPFLGMDHTADEIYKQMAVINPVDELRFYTKDFWPKVKIKTWREVIASELPEAMVFEGAQGMLLDEKYGCSPYNTWSNCSFGNATKLLSGMNAQVLRVGVTRTYFTRHGAGPFVAETGNIKHSELHNVNGQWQGSVRKGYLDIPALRYSLQAIGGVDFLALTHMDRIGKSEGVIYCDAYVTRSGFEYTILENTPAYLNRCSPSLLRTESVVDTLESNLNFKVGFTSWGPKSNEKVVSKVVGFRGEACAGGYREDGGGQDPVRCGSG